MNQYAKHAIINGDTSLGIELGSTRIKAVLIDHNFSIIASSSYNWENKLVDGYWTYSIDEMIHGLQQVYRQLKLDVEKKYGIVLQRIGSIGCSAMMQGYIALDKSGDLLVPFRTWRNATTGEAALELTEKFKFKIPQRWSIAHLYQAILNNEKHVKHLDYIITMSGYVHWRLTGNRTIGICDASGMFPIDESTKQFNEGMLDIFDDLTAGENLGWHIRDVLPEVNAAGKHAGYLHESGALLLDPSGNLKAGIPLCPPEGDAATGMVATNSVKKRTGNISAGTSIFAMLVLEKDLSAVYPEIDIINTPEGNPVAMVLANNCSGDINAWVSLFEEFYQAMGLKPDSSQIFNILFKKAMEADADGGGLLSYGYYSAENITGFAQGRPLFVRSAESRFNLANFMRMHLFTAFAALRIGIDILTQKEHMNIDNILAHGGLFKTPIVGQKMCAAALNIPVSVMSTAGEGGAWGMAVLARFSVSNARHKSLTDYLANKVFKDVKGEMLYPEISDVNGFTLYMERYKEGLAVEQAAIEHLIINTKEYQ